jgi:voltage-gated potassium channel Kch
VKRSGRRALWIRYRWPVLAGLAVVGLVLGSVGYARYGTLHHQHYSVLDVLYNDLSLLGPLLPIPGPVPWELQIARYLVPAVLLYGVIAGFVVLFRDRFEQARLPFLRGHDVVVGAGVKGLAFVKALRAEHRTVVVIESDAGNPNLASVRQAGAIVIVGDATDRDILDIAGIGKARHLVATASDATNVELAMQARQMKQGNTGVMLECLAHVVDPELCTLLKRQALMDGGVDEFRLDFFNFHDHAARRVCEAGLRTGDRLVTVGEGPLTDQIIIYAVTRSMTAAEPLDVTVTGAGASARIAALTARHPQLSSAARLHAIDVAPDVMALRDAGVLRADSEPATVFVSDLDEETSLQIALGLADLAAASRSQIVVCTSQADGLARVLSTTGPGSPFEPVVVVALAGDACTSDLVDRGIYELLGRSIHENYRTERRREGTLSDDDPSLAPWTDLAESLKDSNRAQAEHIGVKLRTVGCDLIPSAGSAPSHFEPADAEIELLARMEHDRWSDERRRAGWRLGPELDPIARTTPYLVDWDQLTEDIRDRDRETIRALPQVVSAAGFHIVRLRPEYPKRSTA